MSKSEILKQLAPHIEKSEGFRAKPYKDPLGKWTIGYGLLLEQPLPRYVVAQLMPDYSDYTILEYTNKHWTKQDYAQHYKHIFEKHPITEMTASYVMHAILDNLYDEINTEFSTNDNTKKYDVTLGSFFPNEQMCVIDIAYNIGVRGLFNFKGFLNELILNHPHSAIGELLISHRAGQVWGRTKANCEMLLGHNLDVTSCKMFTNNLLINKYSNLKKPRSYYAGLVNAFTEKAFGEKLYIKG